MNYGTVEALFAKLHLIRSEKRIAFKARLKHLQRLGFPPGINTGTGRAASYGAGEVFLLGLAIELIQLGLSPERAKSVLIVHTREIAQGLVEELLVIGQSIKGEAINLDAQMFIGFDPETLQDLSSQPNGIDEPEDMASYSFLVGDWSDLRKRLGHYDVQEPGRLALIPMTRFVLRLFSKIAEISGGDEAMSFLIALGHWATDQLRHD
ncbi:MULTISPECIES: hypothetical protein [Sphingobium]|nr:hypothetical protein [Sphingobium sp.]MBR2270162.1 hypothetical protein [Sphingobium sp.]